MRALRQVVFASIASIAGLVIGFAQSAVLPQNNVQALSNYLLSSDDEVTVRVSDVSEIPITPFRIDQTGYIRLPLIGRTKAAGLTTEQLGSQVQDALRAYVLRPEVNVAVSTYRSQPVSVLGCVKSPGVFQLEGRRSLGEIISLAGGVDSTASGNVKVTRRLDQGRIPRLDTVNDVTGRFSSFEASLSSSSSLEESPVNLELKPFDVITVPRARMVYVVGQVQRSGGFVLQERGSIGVLQALALAGGMDATASPEHSRVLHTENPAQERVEIPVDLRKVLQGKAKDVQLAADDILFIPSSAPKKAAIRALETAIQMGTGIVIWRK